MEIRALILYLMKSWRSQINVTSDLAYQIDAIYQYLSDRDPQFAAQFVKLEAEAEVDPSMSVPTSVTLRQLDEVIRRLESGEILVL
jgi:hypothetical protein